MKTAFKSASSGTGVSPVDVQGHGQNARATDRTALQAAALYAFGVMTFIALFLVLTPQARADSLWTANGQSPRSMFADRKASGKGDILTIIVAESAVAQSSQNKSANRESTLQDAIQRFLYSGLAAHHGEMPSIGLSGKSTYSGGGDISNSQSLSARAAVLVTDVLPNGNFVIEGVRIVRFSGETQYVVLHGLVRPDDISRDNSIISTNIAEARVEFYAEGSLTDAQKRGWLSKVYEKLRPF